ncbi:GNAT family N-acetyltransferase [Halobacterium wangiae]|uniref:GNAT family N-acetyltransferase n=1 Tax=Halobacterium wangiae TaxID=2902623 RepID=UPI001E2C40D0|nr:GNAT family N-acetyltransferase [Halobacterium wangiae]
MNATSGGAGGSDSRVRIRRYDPRDRADVLALDEVVWDRTRSESWFAWKYEENPYITEPPVFLALADGRVVGARPFMAFRLRAGDTTLSALQPSDTMVHPDYRGRGIFTRMTEAAIAHYEDRTPELCFNFPNEQAWPGYEKLGWRAVDEQQTYYRIQNPTAFTGSTLDGQLTKHASRVANPAARTLLSLWTRVGLSPEAFTVEVESGAPVETLTTLYRREIPEQIHASRDEAFYRWRFASPVWSRRTYVATENGTQVAGLVARTRTTEAGITLTQIVEVVPLAGGRRRSAALACLLDRVVADHVDSDVLAATEGALPDDLLVRSGFFPDDRLPLSRFTDHRSTFAVRPLGDLNEDAWTVNDYRLTDTSNWLLSFCERDTT